MSTFNQNVLGINAIAVVGAANPPVFGLNRGFAGIVRNGVGDHTLELQQAVNMTSAGMIRLTLLSDPPKMYGANPIDTNHVRVKTYDSAGNPVDCSFYIEVLEVSPQ